MPGYRQRWGLGALYGMTYCGGELRAQRKHTKESSLIGEVCLRSALGAVSSDNGPTGVGHWDGRIAP